MIARIELQGLKAAMERYDPKKVARAASFALKRCINSGRTSASREIREGLKFNISAADLKRKITTTITSPMQGEITTRGEPIVMSYFKPQEIGTRTKITKTTGVGAGAFSIKKGRGKGAVTGVQVQILKGRKTTLKGGDFKGGYKVRGTWIGRGKGGMPMVFGRQAGTKGALGKEKLWGYKVYSEHWMFAKTINVVKKRINEQWIKEWSNQLKNLSGSGSWIDK